MDRESLRVAILGAAFSANKGAASMLQAVIDNLPDRVGPCDFSVLTTYPRADRAENHDSNVRILSATPMQLAFQMIPLALLSAVGNLVGIPRRIFCLTPALRALQTAHLVVDIAGISFVDSRGIHNLGYNVLMTSVPLLLGKRVVKVSQALGPFRSPLNRFFARLVLPRLHTICARGATTAHHLRELGLTNVVRAADLAFSLKLNPAAEMKAGDVLAGCTESRISVIPSEVVNTYCRQRGIDYVGELARFIDLIAGASTYEVIVFPHSVRTGAGPSKMNDLPICRELYNRVQHKNRCRLIDLSLTPLELRAIIAHCEIVVCSRFHAMISALATETPVVVVGWSHKYGEVLDDFDMREYAVDYEVISAENLLTLVQSAAESRTDLKARIRLALPSVVASSACNFESLARAVEPGS